MQALVIAINYHSDTAARKLVTSLSEIDTPGVEVSVILVDNTQRSDSAAFFHSVRNVNSSTTCLKPDSNLGYFGGANFGLQKYLMENNGTYPDWVLVSNVDIEFQDAEFFARLLQMGQTDDLGLVAPTIWSDIWRCDRNPKLISRPSRRKMLFYSYLYRSFYLANLYLLLGWCKSRLRSPSRQAYSARKTAHHEGRQYAADGNGLQQIYAAQGSCLIFSKEYFLRGGCLSYPCFLFGEEIYVAETVRRLGLRIVYNPLLRLHHDDHVSTGRFRTRKIISYMRESAVFLVTQYFT